jgi:hypothetical protein
LRKAVAHDDYHNAVESVGHAVAVLWRLQLLPATKEDKIAVLQNAVTAAKRAMEHAEDSVTHAPAHMPAGGAARRRWRKQQQDEIRDLLGPR